MKYRTSIVGLLLLTTTALWAGNSAVTFMQPPRVLVIMAQYTDKSFNEASTQASFSEFFNGANYSFEGATGSVQQYFKDQSYGQYVPVFDVVGPVQLPHNQRYYGENVDGEDAHADEMVAEACNLAENIVDFTQYDSDGDGVVDAVIVLYAGVGEQGKSFPEAVFPYMGDLEISDYEYSVVCDGKTISYFCAVPEMETTKYRAGIGTVIHEFAHILGLPNMCVTDGKGTQKTLGDWDVMDHGCYNNRSRTPAGLSAYERFFLGWLEPILLNEPMNVRLRELGASGDCGIITASGQHNLSGINPDPRNFFIVENRQQVGWDQYIPGHGMMLTEIDYVKNKWLSDEVNNVERHPCVDIIEADGSKPKYKEDNPTNGYLGKQTDLFPSGATEYKMFSNKMYFSGVKESGDIISFDFLGGVSQSTVYFSVTNGTCSTASLKETKKGAGVVLPAVTADKNFTFLGWSTRKNSQIPDAGQPGQTFYPMCDCSVFAVIQDNTKYHFDYNLKGVTIGDYIGFNGAYVKTDKVQDVAVTFIKKAGYATPTTSSCLVKVECGNKQLANVARFDADTITVAIPATSIQGDIFITIINVRDQGENGCDAYEHTFTAECRPENNKDLSGYNWNVTVANDNTIDYDKTKGAVFGSVTYPAGLVKLYTEETMGCGVKKVTVTAASGSQSDAAVQVFLAGNQIGDTEYLEETLYTYSFVADDAQSGGLEIRLTNTTKAMYIKKITIEYELLPEDEFPTGVELIQTPKQQTSKILHHGQLLIIHNGQKYNVLGLKIK